MSESFEEIARSIRGRTNWKAILTAHQTDYRLPRLRSHDISSALTRVENELRGGHAALALAFLRAAAFTDPISVIREVRRRGCFRASKYAYRGGPLAYVASALFSDAPALGLDETARTYLSSVSNLLTLSAAALSLYENLVAELRQREQFVLKSLLVVVDRAFRPPAWLVQSDAEKLAEHLGRPDTFSREQQAESLSYLTALFEANIGTQESHLSLVDENGIRRGDYLRLLADGYRLIELREAEVLVDAFPYQARAIDGAILLSSTDPAFERSIRLGYVQTMLQEYTRSHAGASIASEAWTVQAAAKSFSDVMGTKAVQRRFFPVDRYVMSISLNPALIDILGSERLFKEEVLYRMGIQLDSFGEPNWLDAIAPLPGLRVIDLIKLQRFFHFASQVLFHSLDGHPDTDDRDGLDMRSRIAVFPIKALEAAISAVAGPAKAGALLEAVTYDPKRSQHFDLQYRPLMKIGNYYLVPMSVIATADIVRNVLQSNNKRLLPADGHDPMQRSISSALKSQGFRVAIETSRDFRGAKIEVDVLAYRDGKLFALECKNSFHPCSPHELRTSFDHALKASGQLARIHTWLSQPGAWPKLAKELGWGPLPTIEIHTCIVTANRMFSGYHLDGQPIRHAHEMLNLLSTGTIGMPGTLLRVWRAEKFSTDDLVDYVRGDSITKDANEAMIEETLSVNLGRRARLSRSTFGFDFERFREIAIRRYASVEASTPDMTQPLP